MVDAVERLVNLALCFADARGPVSARRVREEVFGYPEDQDDAAFARMFERDKDDLRSMGFAIESDAEGNYRLDRAATYTTPIALDPADLATIRLAAFALAEDPSFPFGAELRLALAKLAVDSPLGTAHSVAHLADEDPTAQGNAVALLASAIESRKCVSFRYTNSAGTSSAREAEPYGLFLHDGRWYLVGRVPALGEIRTFAVTRMEQVTVNASSPKTADFERPDDFDVATFEVLPFEYGPAEDEFEATLRFDAASAWRAPSVTRKRGVLSESPDGSAMWTVNARDARALVRHVLENGPGITIVGPNAVLETLEEGLSRVVSMHA